VRCQASDRANVARHSNDFRRQLVHIGFMPSREEYRASEYLEKWLAGRKLHPGDRLPPERELATKLGVGRAAVRRALATLEASGRLTRHVGRGTFLAEATTQPAGDGAPASPADVMEMRLLLEPRLAVLAVSAATARDLEQVMHCLERGEAARSYEEFERWDAALHRTLAEATHNPLAERLYRVVQDARDDPLWGNLKRRTFSTERRALYQSDHRQIAYALVERDAPAIENALRAHLTRVRTNLFGEER